MPMGPLELLDQVGIDVAHHVATSMGGVVTGVERVAETLSLMVSKGQLGKKSGCGFYHYSGGKQVKPLSFVAAGPVATGKEQFCDDGLTATQRRLVYPMLSQSIRCLEEHVVDQAWAIDLAMVLGTGFAPHRGGPLHLVDQIGADQIVANSKRLAVLNGPRFLPPETLVRMAETGTRFFDQSTVNSEGNAVSP
jgi:3-hydroxyacyl-CoA dehydrogenase/enoyl-CoA hydratase/3-hydroxybutyryl-CoA epimerase